MKKLAVLISVFCFIFVACNNNQPAPATEEPTEQCDKKHGEKECQMTEEQKADMEAWKNWDNQTTEKKEELVAKRKACIDKKMAEKSEKCDAEKKEQCPEKEAKCAEMKAKFDNWNNLTLDEKKALLDEMQPKKCCKEGGDKKCCKDGKKKECEHKETK
jgi:hypothetical protein